MTREEIMAMPAGPDIDRLVAEALGETEAEWHKFAPHRHCYSTDIGSSWKLVEKIAAEHLWFCSVCLTDYHQPEVCYGQFAGDGSWSEKVAAPTVPLAICRAFLIIKEKGDKP